MDPLTHVQIIVYSVGAFGLILCFLAWKYVKPPTQGKVQEK